MAKIYSTVQEEIRRKSNEKGFEDYLNMLLSLYSPKDVTHEKHSLLSLYINHGKNLNHLDMFFKEGHLLQLEKIKPEKWDKLIDFFIKNDRLNEFELQLPVKYNICYSFLCIPTIHRHELFKKYHRPEFSYENKNHNLLHDMFKTGTVTSKNISILSDVKEILKTIYFDKGISSQGFQDLLDDKIIDQFKEQFENYLGIDKLIREVLSLKPITNQDSPQEVVKKILETWKFEIEHAYLDKNLVEKNNVHQAKIKI